MNKIVTEVNQSFREIEEAESGAVPAWSAFVVFRSITFDVQSLGKKWGHPDLSFSHDQLRALCRETVTTNLTMRMKSLTEGESPNENVLAAFIKECQSLADCGFSRAHEFLVAAKDLRTKTF